MVDLASVEDPVPQGVPEAPYNPDPPRYLGRSGRGLPPA